MQACRERGSRIEAALRALDAQVATTLHREAAAASADGREIDGLPALIHQRGAKAWLQAGGASTIAVQAR